MKLVEFSNGKWGIRTYWWFGWHFLDFDSVNTSRRMSDKYFGDCQRPKERAEDRIFNTELSYRVVKAPQGGLEGML